MADVFRGPLVVGRRDPPPAISGVFAATSLLVTTLAVLSAPVGAQSFPQQDHYPSGARFSLNQDASRGTPKALLADAQLPIGRASHVATPPRPAQWLNPDESAGTPKNLIADAKPPIFVAPGFAPDAVRARAWLSPDTTADQPTTLKAIILAPFVPAPDVETQRRFPWLPADTTQDSPQTLRADAQAPVGKAQTYALPDRVRIVVDTTAGTSSGLRTLIAAPFVPAAHFAPVQYVARPAEVVHLGVPKALIADAQLPVRNAPHAAPSQRPPLLDTTAGLPPLAISPAIVVVAARVTASDTWTYTVSLSDAPAAFVLLTDEPGA